MFRVLNMENARSSEWLELLENVDASDLGSMIELKDSAPSSAKRFEEYSLLVDVINMGGLDSYLDDFSNCCHENLRDPHSPGLNDYVALSASLV